MRGGRVDVHLRRAEAGGVELAVSDNGPGIPADERARVFDRFYRLADAPTGGSGLAWPSSPRSRRRTVPGWRWRTRRRACACASCSRRPEVDPKWP